MKGAQQNRGGAPVGYLTDVSDLEASTVLYFRLWCEGPDCRARVWSDFATSLGTEHGRAALNAFEDLCTLLTRHCRRRLMRHGLECSCLGADEAIIANFVAAATQGDQEDATLLASLLVRSDLAAVLTGSAQQVGLAIQRINRRAKSMTPPEFQTLHQLH